VNSTQNDPYSVNSKTLKNQINAMQATGQGGQSLDVLKITLAQRLSFPFAAFIAVVLALPLARKSARRARISAWRSASRSPYCCSFVYYLMMSAFSALGKNEAMNPYLAAWAPNIIMGAAGAIYVPARGALRARHARRRARSLVALILACAWFVGMLAPAAAVADPQNPPTDPRLIQLIKHSCGGGPASAQRQAEISAIQHMLADAMPQVGTPPPGVPLRTVSGTYVAQATPTDTPTPSAAQSPSAPSPTETPASPATSDTSSPEASASPDQSVPSPSPTATPLHIPGVPPPGPGELIAPTPQPSSSVLTPLPIPSATPTISDTGPVFIVRPSGTPSPLPIKGASPGPSAAPTAPGGSPEAHARTESNRHRRRSTHRLERRNQSPPISSATFISSITEGQIVGDRAHYDGDHTITVTGHTYLINRRMDSILVRRQDHLRHASRAARPVAREGESIEGVQQGKLHFAAESLVTRSNGVTHGEHAQLHDLRAPARRATTSKRARSTSCRATN
jgi:hypothetical protein